MKSCNYNSVQTMGTLDGPGVRFVLFLQGCPLHCGYCHNPETQGFQQNKTATSEEIMAMVMRCRNYFGKKGGITVSGGEPLMQADFTEELFTLCKKENIHTCIDTSGCIINNDVKRLLKVTDLVILDMKMTNDGDYQKYIGCSMSKPLEFLQLLSENGNEAWLRQVIVKGVNDSEENIRKFSAIADKYDNVKFAELLPFRKLCETKYSEMGIKFPFEIYPETDKATVDRLSSMITKFR